MTIWIILDLIHELIMIIQYKTRTAEFVNMKS